MSKQKNTANIIINTLSLIVLTTLSMYYIPVCIVSLFLIPALISRMICNWGLPKSILAGLTAIIFCIVYSLTGTMGLEYTSIISSMLFLFPGYIIGISYRKSLKFAETLSASVALDFIVSAALIAYCKYGLGVNLTEQLRGNMTDFLFSQIDIIASLYPDTASQLADTEGQIFSTMYVVTPGLIPFCIFVSSIIMFLPRYMLSKSFCNKYLIENSKFSGGFDTFSAGIVTFVAYLICIAGITLSTSNLWFMVFFSAFLCISCIYILVALSIIDFKLKAKTYSAQKRYLLLFLIMILFILLCVVMPVINPIYIFLLIGITDTFFDIRKLKPKKGEFHEEK